MMGGGDLLMVCPQGPLEMQTGPGTRGYGWFPISTGGPPDPSAMVAAGFQLRAFLDEMLERYPVDPKQLLLMGFSQGGVMAYDLALGRPDRFKALVALSSWLPDAVLAGLGEDPARAALVTLLIHGSKDPMIAIDNAQDARSKLSALGIEAAWGEYEMGHEISQSALRDLVSWLAAGPFAEVGTPG